MFRRCEWINKSYGSWYVRCRAPYVMLDEFWTYKGMKYCMFCGKKIKWGK